MLPRLYVLSLILLACGCSQRAPYRVIPAPASPARAASASARGADDGLRPALATASAVSPARLGELVFPVAATGAPHFDDSFDAPRDGGRRHHAIDILAPRGTPVLSVQDGRILRLSTNPNGGITIYATDLDEQFVYYYAHLDHYQSGLYAGRPLLRGDTIGYVGTTGNAPENVPHLHFQVMRMPADRRYWDGEPINPYEALRAVAPGDP